MKITKKQYVKPEALSVQAESMMQTGSKGDRHEHGNLTVDGNDGGEWFISRKHREITWVWSDDEQETSWTGR